jgi:hypothetical protein
MANVTVSLKHQASQREQPCGACGAQFVPAEDSGSRVLSMKTADQPAVVALMCGGCASKWTYGTTMTLARIANPDRSS